MSVAFAVSSATGVRTRYAFLNMVKAFVFIRYRAQFEKSFHVRRLRQKV